MRGQNYLPATASPADSEHSILILRGNLETDQHLYLAFLCYRDYFARPVASLSCFFAPQGLFRPASCISIWLFCFTGIISAGQLHLYLALFLHRDYFDQPDASLSGSFVPQGLFRPDQMHLYLVLFTSGIISTCQIEVLPEFLIFFQLLHFYFSLLDVELPFSVCQEQPFWHH